MLFLTRDDGGRAAGGDPGSRAPRTTTLAVAAAAAALALAGCGDSSTGPEATVPLALSTTVAGQFVPADVGPAGDGGGVSADAGPAGAAPGVRADVTVRDSTGATVTVRRVYVVVGDIRLRPAGTTSCGSGDACEDVTAGPLLLRIPLDGSVATRGAVGRVAASAYDGISFSLTAAPSGSAITDSVPELEGQSLLVGGTYNDTDFTLTAAAEVPLSLTFGTPMDLSDAPNAANVTVQAEVSQWFRDADGLVIDPTSSGAAQAVGANAAQAVTAFPDRDTDGSPDSPGGVGG